MTTIRAASLADVAYLADHLRKADIDEVRAVGWDIPADALAASITCSTEAWTALDTAGNPAVVFGVAPESGHVGNPWMLATDYINVIPKEFLRVSRRVVQRMHQHFPVLSQHVDYRNVASVCWMQWLGFEIHKVVPRYSVERRPFIHFIREQQPCA